MKQWTGFEGDDLFKRYHKNPILSISDWPYKINSVFNPGAIQIGDGTIVLLCRVEGFSGHSHLCIAQSVNGIDGWEIDADPTFLPDSQQYPEELWGIEDPRITYLEDSDSYAIVYTSYSRGGPGVSLALTKDFKRFERYGVIMPPDDKDAALFPCRIGERWVLIHRPTGPFGSHIWISYSPDLKHWGDHKMILKARKGGWWDANKIGLCTPPIETSEGWLLLYHGVRKTASTALYRLGLALYDRTNPEKCLLRGNDWIFGPREPYEKFGDVDNVVFPCGYILHDDGDILDIYYGAADSYIAIARASVKELLEWLHENGQKYD